MRRITTCAASKDIHFIFKNAGAGLFTPSADSLLFNKTMAPAVLHTETQSVY
jgi:hypothetical protein